MDHEPGDVPDPIAGYAADPVDRVCWALKAILVFSATNAVATVLVALAALGVF